MILSKLVDFRTIPFGFIFFPFSFRGKEKPWLKSLPSRSITYWDSLDEKFLGGYFPFGRTTKLRNEILSFKEVDEEIHYESLERWKEFLRKFPFYGLHLDIQI